MRVKETEADQQLRALYDNRQQPTPKSLEDVYERRVKQDRDLVVLITDDNNDRGTGKTTLALQLASWMDRTDEGMISEKATLDPHPLIQAYTEQPKGSGLVLDESEVGMDKYAAGSGTNSAIRELVSMGRVEEKYTVLNAPGDHLVDNDLKSLVDVWILVKRRGLGQVYRMGWNPHGNHKMTKGLGTIEWDPIEPDTGLKEVYDYLTKKKKERLRGEDDEGYIKRSEAREMVEAAREEAAQEKRDEMIRELAGTDLTQSDIADVAGISASRVSQIL